MASLPHREMPKYTYTCSNWLVQWIGQFSSAFGSLHVLFQLPESSFLLTFVWLISTFPSSLCINVTCPSCKCGVGSLHNCCHESCIFSIGALTWPSVDFVLPNRLWVPGGQSLVFSCCCCYCYICRAWHSARQRGYICNRDWLSVYTLWTPWFSVTLGKLSQLGRPCSGVAGLRMKLRSFDTRCETLFHNPQPFLSFFFFFVRFYF